MRERDSEICERREESWIKRGKYFYTFVSTVLLLERTVDEYYFFFRVWDIYCRCFSIFGVSNTKYLVFNTLDANALTSSEDKLKDLT